GRGNEEEGRFKLDDRLERIAAAEMLPESPGKALKTGRHGGQVLGILTAKVGGRSDRQTIPGQDHGFVDLGDSRDEVVQQPVQVAARVHSASPSSGGSPGDCGVGVVRNSPSAGSAMERPRCQPSWSDAMVFLAASGEGPAAGSSAAAGIGVVGVRSWGARFACRTRTGSPSSSGG